MSGAVSRPDNRTAFFARREWCFTPLPLRRSPSDEFFTFLTGLSFRSKVLCIALSSLPAERRGL